MALAVGLLAFLFVFNSIAIVDMVREIWFPPVEDVTRPSRTYLEQAWLDEHQPHDYVIGERFDCAVPCITCHSEGP